MARIQSDIDSSGAPDIVTAVAGTAIGSATKSGMCHSTSMTSIMSDETTDSHSHSEVVGPCESTSASMGLPKLGSAISGERIPVDIVVVVNGCITPAEGSLRLSKKRSIDRSGVKEPFPLGPVLPLASLSLRMAEPPAPPLLALGHGNSSSHLSLVSLDPHRSIIRREALMKLKQDYIVYGSGRPSLKQTEREKERERKRSARDRADEEEQKRLMKKRKEKMLPIVTKDSLFALERQLCSRQESSPDDEGDESKMKKPLSPLASRATTELAALALARHLVDWTESLGVDIVSDSEEEDEDAEETEMQEDVEHIDGDVDAHESGTSPMLLASPSPHVLPSSDDSLPSAQPCFLQRQASSSCLVPLVYSPATSMSTASSLSSSTSMECPLTSTTMTPSTSVWTPELHHQSSTGTMDSFESLEDEHDHLHEYHDHGDYSSCQQSVEYTTLNRLLDQPPMTDYSSMVEFEMPPIMADTYLTSSSLLSLSPLPSPKLSPLSSSSLLPAFPFHSFNSPQHPPQHPPQHWAFSLDSVTLASMTPTSQKMDLEGIESALSVPLATTTTSTSTISLIQRKTIPLKT